MYTHTRPSSRVHLNVRSVLYRDIKPENIGFDVRGDVKIFDFGLAKELNPIFSDRDGTYQLTAMTGSLRYMAPEVLLGQRYNETADVYSLSVLLWQLLSLRTPYEHYVRESIFRERMAHMGKRPPIDAAWPVDLRDLLRRGWSANLADRPTMGHVSLALKYELDRYCLEETIDFIKPFDLHLDTDELDDDDVSRKSEMSYARLTAVEPVPSLLSTTMTVETPPKDRNAVAATNPRRLRRS
jgi:serine/threonine protein kinase